MSIVDAAIQTNAAAQKRDAEATAEAIKQATEAIGRSTRTGKAAKADADLVAALIADGSLTERDAVQIENDCRQLWEAFDLLKNEAEVAEAYTRVHAEHVAWQAKNRAELVKATAKLKTAQRNSAAMNAAKTLVAQIRAKLSVLFSDDGQIVDPAQKSK